MAMPGNFVRLKPLGDPPTGFQLPCVALSHNELRILPEFLSHYRRLGVDRFLIVDDHSTDGSREYLLAQPDVSLFEPAPGSTYSNDKRYWRAELLDAYATHRWVVVPDIDERLVYRDCETRDLHTLIHDLDAEGAKAMHATMVDMYRDAPLEEQRHDAPTLIESFPLLDGPDHYFRIAAPANFRKKYPVPHCMVIGGMRQRLFQPLKLTAGQERLLRQSCDIAGPFSGGAGFRLAASLTRFRLRSVLRGKAIYNGSKLPLIRWQPGMTYYNGAHAVSAPIPLSRHSAVLLHFKFAGGVEASRYTAARGQHTNGAQFYKMMLDRIEDAPSPRFDGSLTYRSSVSLLRLLT
jgi:hypothetical protein